MAARLGLALLTKPAGVAVFWPAAGVSSGILISMGRRARWPVVIGVVAATVAANLMGDRTPVAAIFKGLCNAGEALLVAWLIERWFGERFTLDSMRRVLGFLAAAGIAAGTAAIGGAITMRLFHITAPVFDIWCSWFLSDGLGIITIAPLSIGFGQFAREWPPWREPIEGLAALALLALGSAFVLTMPPESWLTLLSVAALFPLLLWVAARYRPEFAAAATFIVAAEIVYTTTFGIGHFGNADIPAAERTLAAQGASLIVAICTLLLAGLFAERRQAEVMLKRSNERLQDSNERLQLALSGAELGAFGVDLSTGNLECDARAARLHGHTGMPKTLEEGRRFIHPNDLRVLDAAFAEAKRKTGTLSGEYRVLLPGSDPLSGEVRWVTFEGYIVRDAEGKPRRLLGVTRDVTEQKLAMQSLRKQEEVYRKLLGALPAAIYTTDALGYITYCNQAAIELWGAAPQLGKDKWFSLARFYHPDGSPMPPHTCPTAIALKEGRVVCGREAILERLDGTRIPIAPHPAPLIDDTGAIVGVVNMTLDIGERKRAEAVLNERNAQLELAEKVALVGMYAFDIGTGVMQLSPGYAVIHGLPEGTSAITREDWKARLDSGDLTRLDAERNQSFKDRQRERFTEYRIRRPNGEARWIESRSLISYSSEGRALRMLGVNIDVTERKRDEAHKAMLMAELDHRVKNALACVSVIAQQSRERSRSLDEFLAVLDGRIQSLANTHTLLSRGRWQGVSLAALVHSQLAPCAADGNTRVEGPDAVLAADATQAVGMVLHELVTNAVKYGALSTSMGLVSVRWSWRQNGDARRWLGLEWEESGGPRVVAPSEVGYGTTVIRDLIPYELGGSVDLAFAATGVRCLLKIPVEWLRSGEVVTAASPLRPQPAALSGALAR